MRFDQETDERPWGRWQPVVHWTAYGLTLGIRFAFAVIDPVERRTFLPELCDDVRDFVGRIRG